MFLLQWHFVEKPGDNRVRYPGPGLLTCKLAAELCMEYSTAKGLSPFYELSELVECVFIMSLVPIICTMWTCWTNKYQSDHSERDIELIINYKKVSNHMHIFFILLSQPDFGLPCHHYQNYARFDFGMPCHAIILKILKTLK